MKYMIMILIALIVSSCGTSITTSEDLALININLTLDNAKEIYSGLYNKKEGLLTKKVNGNVYTILILKRITSTEKKTVQTNSVRQNIKGPDGRITDVNSGPEYRTEYDNNITNFYLIFENQNYLFAGYGYEAKISTNKELYNQLIDFAQLEENKQ